MPMITVTGACCTLATLPGDMQAASCAFASAPRTKTKRAGLQLAEVGPHFSNSYSACSVASGKGRSR